MRLIVPLLALLLVAGCDRESGRAPQAETELVDRAEGNGGVDRSQKGTPAPDVLFRDPQGNETRLRQFRGKPLLVNLWASWCAPCVKELPTLQQLNEARRDSRAPIVIAVSQDMAPAASIDAFLEAKGIGRFAAYHDEKMDLSTALGVQVMPTTVLYDSRGLEVWRFVGDLDWTSDEASMLLQEVPDR